MKYLRSLVVTVLFLTISSSSFVMAQCGNGTQNGTLDPITTSFQFFTSGAGGEYQTFTAVFGEQYEFSYCSIDGGTSPYDTEMTILDNADVFVGYASGGYSDDDCDVDKSRIIFTPSTSGTYWVLTNLFGCGSDAQTSTLAYRSLVVIDIEENSPIESLQISPNPTSGIVSLKLDDFQGEKLDVTIADVTGRVVISEENITADGHYTANYDLSTLTKGMYLLTLNMGNKTRTEKIILQ